MSQAASADDERHIRLHRSTRWLLTVIAVGLTLTISTRVLGQLDVYPADRIPVGILYLALVLGAVLMMGNIIVTEAWLYRAERTRNKEVMTFAAQAVNWADVFFTAPGIYLVVISGLLLTEQQRAGSSWIVGVEISFILAGVTWLLFLVPMQNRLAVHAAQSRLNERFYKTLHRWYWLGLLATALTLVAVLFVVFQPQP